MTPFDPEHEIRAAIGESYRDGKVAIVKAANERDMYQLERAAEHAAKAEGGGHSASGGGYWHGAPDNDWRVRVEADEVE